MSKEDEANVEQLLDTAKLCCCRVAKREKKLRLPVEPQSLTLLTVLTEYRYTWTFLKLLVKRDSEKKPKNKFKAAGRGCAAHSLPAIRGRVAYNVVQTKTHSSGRVVQAATQICRSVRTEISKRIRIRKD